MADSNNETTTDLPNTSSPQVDRKFENENSTTAPVANSPQPATSPQQPPVPIPISTAADSTAQSQKPTEPDNSQRDKKDSSPDNPTEAAPKADAPKKCALDLVVFDSYGRRVPKVPLRIFVRGHKDPVYEGTTDSKGSINSITSMDIGTNFEVQIKNDRGEYKLAAIGTLNAEEVVGNLSLPHQRFEFSTYSYTAAPGAAEEKKEKNIQKHKQQPDGQVKVDRNPTTSPNLALERDKAGRPQAMVNSGQQNMLGQNRISAVNPNIGLAAPEKVKKLLEFAMEQLTWIHPQDMTSQTIIRAMKNSTYHHENRPQALGYKKSLHRCAKYVKIALWKAGYIPSDDDFAPTVSPARLLGPGLISAGFTDITTTLPDARWAAPGDVIVYRDLNDPDGSGHIDIRSYDGYISDFWDSYLPVSQFEVIGIYRKYFDPLPEKRMRAFLKVIRSREAATVYAQYGDEATYKALPNPGIKHAAPPMFDNFDVHPLLETKGGTPSGAYGITAGSWGRYVNPRTGRPAKSAWVYVKEGQPRFSPTVQDRIAIAMMEHHQGQGYGTASYQTTEPTSLALVRTGKIAEAAVQLATKKVIQWTSLPEGAESRGYSTSQMMSDYEKFLKELN